MVSSSQNATCSVEPGSVSDVAVIVSSLFSLQLGRRDHLVIFSYDYWGKIEYPLQ